MNTNIISTVANSTATIPTKLYEAFNMVMNWFRTFLDVPTRTEVMNINWTSVASIIGTISLMLIFTTIAILVLYFLRSIGLYTMARNRNRSFTWLAFIPFGCFFIYGIILKKTKLFGVEIDHPELLLPALLLSSFLPYVGPFASILFILCKFGLLYRIYEMQAPRHAILYLILSIFIPIAPPIILFGIKDK